MVRRIIIDQRKSFMEIVYDSLKKSILHGRLEGGVRLKEEPIARQFGISRTPVREALYKLQQEDLIYRLPKGGFAVRKFTKKDVEEIFGIRNALESYAAYLATLNITKDEIQMLEKKIEESEKALNNGDDGKVVRLNTEFHDLLYNSCKSKKLIEMIGHFRDHFYRYRSALLHTKGGLRSSIDSHRKMLEAMKKKNPRLVETLVRKHLKMGKEIILKEIILKEIEAGRITP